MAGDADRAPDATVTNSPSEAARIPTTDTTGVPAPPPQAKRRRRSPLRKALSRYPGYVLLLLLHALISKLPLPVGCALARLLGSAAYWITPRLRRNTVENLTLAYGAEKSPAEIRAVARRVFQNLALIVVEWAIIGRWSPEKLRRKFPEVCAVLTRATAEIRARGKGAIGITGHIGNWEILSIIYAACTPGFLLPVANRIYFEKYQEFFHRLRTRCGAKLIYTDESPRKIVRAIQQGSVPAFLPDHEVRTNSGVFVEFFRRPTYTTTMPVQLARKFEVPIFFCLLLRDGSGFKAFYPGLIDVPSTDDEASDIRTGTQHWTRVLEEQIRLHPDQWSWIQPRWRSTPDRPRTKVRRWKKERARGDPTPGDPTPGDPTLGDPTLGDPTQSGREQGEEGGR